MYSAFNLGKYILYQLSTDYCFCSQVNEGVSGAEFLKGRIINLGIRCTVTNNVFTRKRLLFKYEGKLTCKCNFRSHPRGVLPEKLVLKPLPYLGPDQKFQTYLIISFLVQTDVECIVKGFCLWSY